VRYARAASGDDSRRSEGSGQVSGATHTKGAKVRQRKVIRHAYKFRLHTIKDFVLVLVISRHS
jgi:hypothetical protein